MNQAPAARVAVAGGWLAFLAVVGGAASAGPPTSAPAGGRRVEFAPGVTIDWERMQVELAARVVLREGLLELFGCSPHTREHESIVAVRARPLHIFQALGLIGLQPGRPVTYDQARQCWLPAAGDRLVINVQFTDHGRERTVNVWDWMANAQSGAPLPPRGWVFCGSRTFAKGVFGADVDGTVICVVDFEAALIGLSESHSADNAVLWVAARTENIPPRGTPCTLLIRAAKGDLLDVQCDDSGRFRLGGRWLDRAGLEAVLRARLAHDPGLAVRVAPLPGVPGKVGIEAVQAVRALGATDVHLAEARSQPTSQPFQPATPPGPGG